MGSEGKGGILAGQPVVFSEDGKSSLCQKQLNPWTLEPLWIWLFGSSSGAAQPCYKLTHLLEKPDFFFFCFSSEMH